LINGSCNDAAECLIEDSDGNCQKGCKHSGNETVSSCVIDECVGYSSGVCSSITGCTLVEGFCVDNSFENHECTKIYSVSMCVSVPNCDIFFGGLCRERVLYNKDCDVVGEEICLNTSNCKWDAKAGCVESEEEEENSKSESFLTWSFFAFLGSFNKIFVLFFFY
jgi:hypothetical protein